MHMMLDAMGSSISSRFTIPNGEQSVLRTLEQLLQLLSVGLALSLVIAIITLALMQLLYPFVRGFSQTLQTVTWRSERRMAEELHRNLSEIPGWLASEADHLHRWIDQAAWRSKQKSVFPKSDILNMIRSVSNGHFMKRLQDASDQVLARPSVSVDEFFWLTRTAPPIDSNTILLLDILTLENPELVANLLGDGPDKDVANSAVRRVGQPKKRPTGIAEAVAAAQQSVTSAAERQLNELQLKLDGALEPTARLVCVMIGLAVASIPADALDARDPLAVMLVGAVGGLLGSLFQDALSSVLRKRR